jgi:hypothetical protein
MGYLEFLDFINNRYFHGENSEYLGFLIMALFLLIFLFVLHATTGKAFREHKELLRQMRQKRGEEKYGPDYKIDDDYF